MHVTRYTDIELAAHAASRHADESDAAFVLAMTDETAYVFTELASDYRELLHAFVAAHHISITRTMLYTTDQGGDPLTFYGTGETLLRQLNVLARPKTSQVVERDLAQATDTDVAYELTNLVAFYALFDDVYFVRERGGRQVCLYLNDQTDVAQKTAPTYKTVCHFYRDGRLCWEDVDNT